MIFDFAEDAKPVKNVPIELNIYYILYNKTINLLIKLCRIWLIQRFFPSTFENNFNKSMNNIIISKYNAIDP